MTTTTHDWIPLLILVALMPLGAAAQTRPVSMQDLTIPQLKSIYLACNDAALAGQLAAGEVAQCSVAYEDLKQRAFGGDFAQLLRWSRAQSRAPGARPQGE